MRKLIYIICAAAALLVGLWGCKQAKQETLPSVDLRYRVSGSLDLAAMSPKPITIVVTSSSPWVVRSAHPDWCIISDEDGAASDAELVRVGKGEKTTVTLQYYDNTDLDDREDVVEIASGDWIGKRLNITQKGTAYLEIPYEEQVPAGKIKGAGEEFYLHISANQKWTVKVLSGEEWLSIDDNAAGEGDGVVTLTAANNPGEIRYGSVGIFDRHDVRQYFIEYTQDGVQLDLETQEIRVGFDQTATSVKVTSNGHWIVTKESETDTWFTIDNPDNTGSGKINITLETNPTDALRKATIVVKTVPEEEGGFTLEREVVLKQAYEINPVWVPMDAAMLDWTSDWTNAPKVVENGILFEAKSRIHKSNLPFGSYTFCWSSITPDAKVRHWTVYGEDDTEMKFNLTGGTASLEFNKGKSESPSGLSSISDVDMSKPHQFTYKYDPSGSEYCKMTFLFDGVSMGSFESSDVVMTDVKWGAPMNLYIGVDSAGSAICEGYWYTAPVNW